jgi:hypothetical protein
MTTPDFDRAATLAAQLFDALPSVGGPACTISYVVEAIIKKAQEHGLERIVEAYGKEMVQASLDDDALVEGIGEVAKSA